MARLQWHFAGVAFLVIAACGTGCRGMLPDSSVSDSFLVATTDNSVELGLALEANGQFADAANTYLLRLSTYPDDSQAIHRLAVVTAQLGDATQSEMLFRRALKLRPADADLLADFGYALYQHGRRDDSRMLLRQAIVWEPEHPQAHAHLGLILCETGNEQEAFHEFRRAGCTEAQSCLNVAAIHRGAGREDLARQALEFAVQSDPQVESWLSQIPELAGLTPETDRMSRAPQVRQHDEIVPATAERSSSFDPTEGSSLAPRGFPGFSRGFPDPVSSVIPVTAPQVQSADLDSLR